MKSMRLMGCGLCVLAFAGLLATAGCSNGAETAVVNTVCPVMGNKLSDPKAVPAKLVREYKGKKIGFCCAGCPGKWDKLSDAEKDAKLAKLDGQTPAPTPTPMQVDNTTCPIMGKKLSDRKAVAAKLVREHKGKKVGFCCAGCLPKWDKLSDAEKDAKLGGKTPAPTPAAVKVDNTTCPIMNNKLSNPAAVPAKLVREYKGKKIGFCCPPCGPKWDKLSDEKKDEFIATLGGGE